MPTADPADETGTTVAPHHGDGDAQAARPHGNADADAGVPHHGQANDDVPPGVEGPPGLLLTLVRDRRVAFLLVGGLNTVIGGLWFLLFDYLIGPRWGGFGHYPALALTYVASILCAFVLYRRFVFRVRGNVVRDLARFSTVYISAFAINLVLLALLVHGLSWHPFLSQCLITFVTTVLSWFGHHHFSFKRSEPEPATTRTTDPQE